MSEVKLSVQVFPHLAVEGQDFTATRVMATAEVGEVGYSSDRLVVDQAIDEMVATSPTPLTREQVLNTVKRDVLRELSAILVEKGIL